MNTTSKTAEHYSDLVNRFAGQAVIKLPAQTGQSANDFDAELRAWRNQQMANIAAADVAGESTPKEVLLAVTEVAEQSVQAAVLYHQKTLEVRYGTCKTPVGKTVAFTVLGMGKLGGGELNFSSDIDLICLYDQLGTAGGRAGITAEEFFSKLVKAVSRSLNAVTENGFVFRVDLRLRPYGGAGPLVMHFDQAEQYYETQGRDWERYAFIKARPIAGDIKAGEAFLERLKPFIYRRYLDFTALYGLRELKAKIEKQYALKRLDENIKLGPGGIREIEFIVQSFQLVRGGECAQLQTPSLFVALESAAELGLLSESALDQLTCAYLFLRTVENRLQQRQDQQVHHLPQSADEQRALAEVLGFRGYLAFLEELDAHRALVRGHFDRVLVAESDTAIELSESVERSFESLLTGSAYEQLSERAQSYIQQVMLNLSELNVDEAGLVFAVKLVEQVMRRSTYLAWLAEQPKALERLLFFTSRSSWMAEEVLQQPLLMDGLLDERQLHDLPNKKQKSDLLKQQLARVGSDDIEQAMDVCRRYKANQQFAIAAADVAGYLPVMRVSDHLTELAEVILQQSLDWVAADLQQKAGRPQLERDGNVFPATMVVIGYGKLGGLELGYGSDLDIVLLHDGDGRSLGTDGGKQLENAVYFQRLGQRFVHFLSANTISGRLYEIDTRLRPSGNSGLLVASLQGYEKYQRESAWTWEHQALVRARAVAGPKGLKQQFERLRSALLSLPRDNEALKKDVIDMRDKMRSHLDDSGDERFNLKQGAGGLVDVEFICQYLVLRDASNRCDLFEVTDNIRQLERLAANGALKKQAADKLAEAYVAIRGATHHERLGCMNISERKSLEEQHQQVVAIWKELLE